MKRWFYTIFTLLIINILIIVFQYINLLTKVKYYSKQIEEIELVVQDNSSKIQELKTIQIYLDKVEIRLDTLLDSGKNKNVKKINFKDDKPTKSQTKDNTQTENLTSINKPIQEITTNDSLQLTNNSKKIEPNHTTKSVHQQNNEVFIGIVGYYSKNRKKQLVSPNDRLFWIELESEYSLLSSSIKKVTINGMKTEIKEIVEEEKKSVGRKVKFTYLLSYFILVNVDKNVLVEGNNKITVYADKKYENELFIK